MPSRTISVLGYTCGALTVAYLLLVSATVFQAAWQTNLAMEVHETESEIGRLESRYYDMIAQIDRTDPMSRGLTAPAATTYAATAAAPAITLR